jgi:hypothetical protein
LNQKNKKHIIIILVIGLLFISQISLKIQANPNQIPTVTITSPSNGETIRGVITITGTASDPDGIIKVVAISFDYEQETYIADGTTDWSYILDTTKIPNGEYAIEAKSYDGELLSNPYTIEVNIENKDQIPTIKITHPKDGSTKSGKINITGTATFHTGTIKTVQIKIDNGIWNIANGETNWTFSWDTTTINDGKHTISARSYDGEKYSNIISIKIIIDNIIDDENEIPIIKFTHPLTGDNISGIKNIYGSSTDSDGIVQYVQIKIDTGPWKNVNGTNLWSYIWDTTNETNGEHIIYARSYDGQNYSTLTSINLTVNNKSTPGFELVFLIISLIISLIIINSYKKNSL